MRTRFFTVAFLLAIVLSTTPNAWAFSSGPGSGVIDALPDISCSREECDGLDPNRSTCKYDAQTYARADIKYGRRIIGQVELRGSPQCGTNWAKVTSWAGETYRLISEISQDVYEPKVDREYDPDVTQAWSGMIYSPTTPTQACGFIEYVFYDDGRHKAINNIFGCTGVY